MVRKRHKSKRLVVVLLSDTHSGHRLGLLNPATVLTDEHGEAYSPGLNSTQTYLWALYEEHIEAVAALADRSRVLLVHLGDPCQGTTYPAHLALPLISDQIIAAAWTLYPWYEDKRLRLTDSRIIVGTGVHGWEGSAEALIANRLAEMYPKVDTKARYHAQIVLRDQRNQIIDCAHHGPFPGSRKWLKGTNAAWYVRSAMLAELVDWVIPPRVYARAHYHEYIHVGPVRVRSKGRDIESDLVIAPCYTGADDHVRKVTWSISKLDHGLVVLIFEDGLQEIVPLYEELDIRTREEL